MSKPEDPSKCMTAEAQYARALGWDVTYHLSVDRYFVLAPRNRPMIRDRDGRPIPFRGMESAWALAAASGGYRPNKAGPLVTRPSPTLKAKQGRSAALVNVLRHDR